MSHNDIQPGTPAATVSSRRAVGLGAQVASYTGALLRAWVRDPGIIVQSLVFPAFMLAMFHLVFGESTTAIGLGDSIFGTTGLVALVGAMFGTAMAGLQFIEERDTGLLQRLWTLPVARSGYLIGRIVAEVVRMFAGTVILFAVAVPLGFRFTQGWLAGLGALVVPVLLGVGVAFLVIAVATVSGKAVIQQLSILFLLMLFFNTGFAPVEEYPGWLEPVVRYQPMSLAIDTMSGLTEGGPVRDALIGTLVWSVGLSVVFGVPAVRGYRRAVQGD